MGLVLPYMAEIPVKPDHWARTPGASASFRQVPPTGTRTGTLETRSPPSESENRPSPAMPPERPRRLRGPSLKPREDSLRRVFLT